MNNNKFIKLVYLGDILKTLVEVIEIEEKKNETVDCHCDIYYL
jgi:acyl dehydratase